MPADAPPGSVAVTLLSGRIAEVSRPLKGWPTAVRIVIQPPTGLAGPPAIYERYTVGTPAARRTLVRDAGITDQESVQLDAAALEFRNQGLAFDQAEQAEAAVADAAQRAPNASDWGILPLEAWSSANPDAEHQQILLHSIEDFLQLCQQSQGPDVFLRWPVSDLNRLAVLDCDFHAGRTPTAPEMLVLQTSLQPAPVFRHTTSRGFHAYYAPCDGLRADELAVAAAAALTQSSIMNTYQGTVEVLRQTRHPKSAHHGKTYGPLMRMQPDSVTPVLAIFDRIACSDAERDEAAAHLGLRIGSRYPHDMCPLDPNHHSSSPAPVLVTEHGMFCYSCHGRTGNGFVSWGSVRRSNGLPTQATGDTTIMTDAIAHWAPHAHVDRLFEALAPHLPVRFRPTLHRLLLRKAHADDVGVDAQIASVFTEFPFIRDPDGLWRHATTLRHVSPRLGRAELSQCSAALRVQANADGEPELKPDPSLVTVLATDGPVKGLFPLLPTPASPIWHIHQASSRSGYLTVKPHDPQRDALRYLKEADRMPIADAMARINQRFPGINFNYLTLLHVARGWGEEGRSQLPMIWASGESSTGKTSHAWVEGALHDETPENLIVEPDNLESLQDKIAAAQGRTGCVMLDDFCKNFEGRDGLGRRNTTITLLLQANRTVGYHAMYVGEKVLPVTSFFLLTDMRHPTELVQHDQLGRRIVMVNLTKPVSWGEGKQTGFTDWWRAPEMRQAAETWHSWVVDSYFSQDTPPRFVEVAAALGFRLLRDVYGQLEDSSCRERLVREFIRALLRRPEASGHTSQPRDQVAEQAAVQRSCGPGWVVLDARNIAPESAEFFAQTLCHSLNYEGTTVDGLKKALEPYQSRLHLMVPFYEQVRIDVRGYRQHAVLVRLQAAHRYHTLHLGVTNLAPGATPDNMLDPMWSNGA